MNFPAKHPWWLDACRLRVGLLKRPQPQVPHMTRPKYVAELDELDRVAAWVLWKHHGGPRPKVWRRVPAYAWAIWGEYQVAHPKPKPKPPEPKPPNGTKPPPSWTLPSALIMTASDPSSANGHVGVGTIGRIIEPGVCPLWECTPVSGGGRGLLGQVEGEDQLDVALALIAKHRQPGDHLAIVGTGNVRADRMVAAGVTVAFYELNAQAGWEPYGNTARLVFQGYQDGWPYVYPSYGCYDGVWLQDYRSYVPMVWSDAAKGFVPGTKPQGLAPYFACFSAEGMGDTDSWPTLAHT